MAESPKMVDGINVVAYRELKIQRLLGRGTFGMVYVAQYHDHRVRSPVVMKQIYEPVDELARNLFMKEAKLLSGLHHENIVRMYGICQGPLVIIMEYVFFDFKPFLNKRLKINTVDKFLLEVSKLPKSDERFDHLIPAIASDITKGLAYLHNLEIAHRDLKPMNVLISNQHYCDLEDSQELQRQKTMKPVVCKLADFGESRSKLLQTNGYNDPGTNLVGRGTTPFMAPEILLPEGIAYVSTKLSLEDLKRVDIWALGQVFYCLMNPGVSYPFEREGVDIPQIMLMHRQRKRPSFDPGYQTKHTKVWLRVQEAFQSCTKHNPSQRPYASRVLAILHGHCSAGRQAEGKSSFNIFKSTAFSCWNSTILFLNNKTFGSIHASFED